MKPSEINNEHAIKSVKYESGVSIPFYDDGFGALYVHRDSMGISGVVRAQSWEDAYGICEDEFFPEAEETIDELRKEYNFKRDYVKWVRTMDRKLTRPAVPQDYPLAENGLEFDHWETVETPTDDENAFADNELFQESFGFRPNGPNKKDKLNHGIYAKDLNGDSLVMLTDKMAEHLGITIEVETL